MKSKLVSYCLDDTLQYDAIMFNMTLWYNYGRRNGRVGGGNETVVQYGMIVSHSVGRPIGTHQARSRDAREGSRLALPPMGLGSSSTHGRGSEWCPALLCLIRGDSRSIRCCLTSYVVVRPLPRGSRERAKMLKGAGICLVKAENTLTGPFRQVGSIIELS